MVGSSMIPRLWTSVEGVTIEPSMLSEKSWVEWVGDFGPIMMMMMISDFRFVAVEFDKVVLHPCFDVCEAGGEGGVGGCRNSRGVEVELDVCATMKLKAMLSEDLSKWQDIDDEKQGTKYRALGDTMSDWGSEGFGVVDGDELISVREI